MYCMPYLQVKCEFASVVGSDELMRAAAEEQEESGKK